ncbi:ExbD/TolR family protein [Teredinibacter purpureus]|uniref:ExbD/TolR family protein n=1 Tax=Teredinibacter purpureus TaxID=2731756 RepID=UPI0005F7A655|nr:biopolymer transporter ExbD [Teredinibacter purpureus]
MRKSWKSDTVESDVDLTPMLDVVFILLIFFVVTASFVREQSLSLVRSPASTSMDNWSTPLIFTVNSRNELFVDSRRIEIGAARALLSQQLVADPDVSVVVYAHEASSVQVYVALLDAAKQEHVKPPPLKLYNDSGSVTGV